MLNKKIIVSITSYPKRINTIIEVINSLFKQSIRPDEIVLWLSVDEFLEREIDLPESLCNLVGINGFKICWEKGNLKSHKKYYYALQRYSEDIVITVDDDIIYSPNMIEELVNSYYVHPYAISARNVHTILKAGHRIADYNMWVGNCKEYEGSERQDLCAIGCSGILYPPHISHHRWFDKSLIKKVCPDQDDLWLKFNEILDKIPTVYVKTKCEDTMIMEAQEYALYKTNVYENRNDVSIEKLYGWCRVQNYDLMEKWFNNLYESNLYYESKRKELAENLKNILENNDDKDIYICGAGKFAKGLLKLFAYIHKKEKILGLLVSSHDENPNILDGIVTLLIEDVKYDENTLIICGVGKSNRQVLKPYFDRYSCCWIDIDIYAVFDYFEKVDYKK